MIIVGNCSFWIREDRMKIIGTSGDDIIEDAGRRDYLTGGDGLDVFKLAQDGKSDHILDFSDGEDKIDLSAYNVTWGSVQVRLRDETSFTVSVGDEKLFVTFDVPVGTELALDALNADDFIFNSGASNAPANLILDRAVLNEHYGTSGSDIFVMEKDYRRDVIRKFDPTKDQIDLTNFNTDFESLEIVDKKPGKILLKLGTEGLVIRDLSHELTGADLTADMFIF
jgi:Ca2+-binding RTX toxin-like protein